MARKRKHAPLYYLRRRQFAQRTLWLLLVVFALVQVGYFLTVSVSEPALTTPAADRKRYDDRIFKVVQVIDGDTLDIDVADGSKSSTRIRLWGVDTPEVGGAGQQAMYYGAQASAFAREKLAGQTVRILLEPQQETRGRYGRLLAYVYLPDGAMFNEMLLVGGYAYADPRFKHVYRERFTQLEKQARRQEAGLWQHARFEDYPVWLQRRIGSNR